MRRPGTHFSTQRNSYNATHTTNRSASAADDNPVLSLVGDVSARDVFDPLTQFLNVYPLDD